MLLLSLVTAQVPRNSTAPQSGAVALNSIIRSIREEAGLSDLRKGSLPRGDEELRYWGFGWKIEGYVLRRRAGAWSGMRIESPWPGALPHNAPLRKRVRNLRPRSGWDRFWAQANRLGIWTMPDELAAPPPRRDRMIVDGYSLDVEQQRGGIYRAFHYTNPEQTPRWLAGVRVIAFKQLLQREFPDR